MKGMKSMWMRGESEIYKSMKFHAPTGITLLRFCALINSKWVYCRGEEYDLYNDYLAMAVKK